MSTTKDGNEIKKIGVLIMYFISFAEQYYAVFLKKDRNIRWKEIMNVLYHLKQHLSFMTET